MSVSQSPDVNDPETSAENERKVPGIETRPEVFNKNKVNGELCMERNIIRYVKWYRSARNTMLLVVILTVVNLVQLFCGRTELFLFFSYFPYEMGATLQSLLEQPAVAHNPQMRLVAMIICGILIVVPIVALFLCWIFSKKRPGWMIVALVLAVLDALNIAYLIYKANSLGGYVVSLIIPGIVIIAIIAEYIYGVVCSQKLKKAVIGNGKSAYVKALSGDLSFLQKSGTNETGEEDSFGGAQDDHVSVESSDNDSAAADGKE